MTLKKRLLLTVLLTISAVLTWNTYVGSRSQAGPAANGLVVSGPDMGFRVEGRKGEAVVGRFVVRVDGQWRDVDTAFAPRVLGR